MRRALALLLLLACRPDSPDVDPGTGSTVVASPTEAPPTDGSGGSSGSLTNSSTGQTDTDAFPPVLDGGTGDPCSIFAQDCPPGMKCMPYADDGGGSWNNDKCVPVVADPQQFGEPCFAADGGVGGVDDCDLGLMCWDVDAENHGICFELCGGTLDEPTCTAPTEVCALYNEATLPLCIPKCNPLVQDCDPSDVCIDNPSGRGFLCVLDAGNDGGQLHDPCFFANACDPGLRCTDSASAVECDQSQDKCCESYCDITLANTCPGAGQLCNAFFAEGTAPPGCENVGFCSVPM